MVYRKIASMGHPILREQAKPVQDLKDPELQRLIHDMWYTMIEASGVGLAAPQVYENLRVIVYRVPEPDQGTYVQGILINPSLKPLSQESVWGWEGCLSIQGLRGQVLRYAHIQYHGLTASGTPITGELQGFPARVLQHEVDHLEGILFVDRMTDLKDLMFEEHFTHQNNSARNTIKEENP